MSALDECLNSNTENTNAIISYPHATMLGKGIYNRYLGNTRTGIGGILRKAKDELGQ